MASALQQLAVGGALMADTFCAHCETLITDRSCVVERGEVTFCCNNCATAFAREQESPGARRA